MTGATGRPAVRGNRLTASPFSFTVILTFIYRAVRSRNTRVLEETANAE